MTGKLRDSKVRDAIRISNGRKWNSTTQQATQHCHAQDTQDSMCQFLCSSDPYHFSAQARPRFSSDKLGELNEEMALVSAHGLFRGQTAGSFWPAQTNKFTQ